MKTENGFTLIEVLIALAILSIALTAIIKATSQNIKDLTYLQNKTMAHWVALYVVNQARIGLVNLSETPGAEENEIEMLNRQWIWQGNIEPTKNKQIKKIIVTVSQPDNDKKIAELESFYYVP